RTGPERTGPERTGPERAVPVWAVPERGLPVRLTVLPRLPRPRPAPSDHGRAGGPVRGPAGRP
ncbi:MAG: hypothetical protein K0R62_7723, partial [Nonomuraea muscovyensis]|nr:hypothetical protein [Nonomuraea muscovyensis]